MIKEIKRNDLRWILPYDLRNGKTLEELNEMAINLVNRSPRKMFVNGFIVVSQNEKDLNYIKDLFCNVRIKLAFINSVRFYVIEYATNYDIAFNGLHFLPKEKQNENFITFEDLLSGKKQFKDVLKIKAFYEEVTEKRNKRHQSKFFRDGIKSAHERLAKELLNKKLSQYQTIKNSSGSDLYIYNNVVYTRYDIIDLNHKPLYNQRFSKDLK